MLHVLLESGTHPVERRTGSTVASMLAHATLIACAVALTTRDRTSSIERARVDAVVYVAPRQLTQTQHESRNSGIAGATARALRAVQAIAVPVIPSVDLVSMIEQPRLADLENLGRENSVSRITESSGLPSDGVYAAGNVDRTVELRRDNPQPDYPFILRTSGIEGSVFVRFVVDSVGQVEVPSIEIIQTTHPLFGAAVRRWLPRTRYVPAELAGQPVAQLVELRVEFTLRR